MDVVGVTVEGDEMYVYVLEVNQRTVGYGVTANIAASHRSAGPEFPVAGPMRDRGSSGFDSPYPNTFWVL
jgi:hypothetical protein